jgi:hypothetical protein
MDSSTYDLIFLHGFLRDILWYSRYLTKAEVVTSLRGVARTPKS